MVLISSVVGFGFSEMVEWDLVVRQRCAQKNKNRVPRVHRSGPLCLLRYCGCLGFVGEVGNCQFNASSVDLWASSVYIESTEPLSVSKHRSPTENLP